MEELTFNTVTAKVELNKHYHMDNGKPVSKQPFPKLWEGVTGYTNEEVTLELIAETLELAKSANIAVLPNLPPNYAGKEFERKKEKLTDHRRNWVQFDIDWNKEYDVPEDVLKGNLQHKAAYVLEQLQLSEKLGYVAQYSSSAHIKGMEELRIRLWLLLKNPMNEQELKQVFSDLDVDLSMFLRGTIHYLKPATSTVDVPVIELPKPDIYIHQGELLDVDEIEIRPALNRHGVNAIKATAQSQNLNRMLFNYFGTKTIPWMSWYKIDEAITELAEQGKLEGKRNAIHFALLRTSHLHYGSCYNAMCTILNHPKVLGQGRSIDTVMATVDKVNSYFANKWGCGELKSLDKFDSVKTVSSFDLKDIAEEIEQWLPESGIVVVQSGCGSGKTQSVIKNALKPFTNSRRISICFRKAVLRQQAEQLGLTYYLDAGIDQPEAAELTEAERKARYLPLCDNPAVTIHSLKYVQLSGQIKPYEVVVIDESEHVIENLFLKPQMSGKNNRFSQLSNDFHTLMTICANAKLVILADDKASAEITGWFAQEIRQFSQKKLHLLLNEKDYIQKMHFTMLGSEAEAVLTIAKLAEEGKLIAVQTAYGNRDDKPDIERIVGTVRQLTGLNEHQVKGWYSGSFDNNSGTENVRDKPDKVLPKLIDKGLQVAIFSPVNSVGWSYSMTDHYAFDAVVNIYNWIGIPAMDIKQGLRRWRLTEEHWVYIAPKKNFIAEQAVEESYREQGFIDIKDPFNTLQKSLLMASNNRLENVRAHFESHITSLDGEFCVNRFKFLQEEIEQVKKALKSSNRDALSEGLERIRQGNEILENFRILDFENNRPVLNPIKALDGLSDTQVKKLFGQIRQANQSEVSNLLDLWMLDAESRKLLSDDEEAIFFYLHGQLLDAVNDVFKPYFIKGVTHLLQWLVTEGEGSLVFHMEGTEAVEKFKAFVLKHHVSLKISHFTELGNRKGWKESPFQVIEEIVKTLGLGVKKEEKLSGIVDGKRIADECKKALIEQYRKQGLLKKSQPDSEKKNIMKRTVIAKKAAGEKLTKAEADYFNCIGRRIVISKPQFIQQWLYQRIIEVFCPAEEDIYELCS